MKSIIKRHKKLFIVLGVIFIIGVIGMSVYAIKNHIDMDEVSYVTIIASNYNDSRPSKYSVEIKDPDFFKAVQALDKSVKKEAGYRVYLNSARWYVDFQYHYKNDKVKTHNYSGDKNFDEIARLIQDFQERYPSG